MRTSRPRPLARAAGPTSPISRATSSVIFPASSNRDITEDDSQSRFTALAVSRSAALEPLEQAVPHRAVDVEAHAAHARQVAAESVPAQERASC